MGITNINTFSFSFTVAGVIIAAFTELLKLNTTSSESM
jgi:hypothetical protein